ncbi:hypothetical protein KSP39_PZI012213 [Platanthera zijinensis]|uniref:OTU domain-containing protein n=1 Tax=Platanthera zijinensis TaxID=2320716 RepID=A0AAP0G4U3_9ASPA
MQSNTTPKKAKWAISESIKFVDKVRLKFAPYWSAHIVDTFDVLGDGHCGYRIISQALNVIVGWAQVRVDLQWKLENRSVLYGLIFGRQRYEELLLFVQYTKTLASFSKWMTMSDMRLIISSFYNIALVH